MTLVEELAAFMHDCRFDDLSGKAIEQLKIRVLDSLGCAFGALQSQPVKAIRKVEEEFGGKPLCTMIGGGKTSPDRATLVNDALVRYLDFNDSFLAKGETCTPATTSPQSSLPRSLPMRRGRIFWLLWRWRIRFNVG